MVVNEFYAEKQCKQVQEGLEIFGSGILPFFCEVLF